MLPANVYKRFVTHYLYQSQSGKIFRFSQYSSTAGDSSDSSSSSSDSSDDEKEIKKEPPSTKNKEAVEKLNALLQSIVKESFSTAQGNLVNDKLAKPKRYFKKLEEKSSEVKEKVPEKTINDVAKEVAEVVGGDVKQTESELLNKLLSHSAENSKKEFEQDGTSSKINLSDLIAGMKIDRTPSQPQSKGSRASIVRHMLSDKQDKWKTMRDVELGGRTPSVRRHSGRVDLFGAEPLGIFPKLNDRKDPVQLNTWENMKSRELQMAVTHPPRNHFQQMIVWTEQGKLWKFPINNEQGMEDEAKISFVDHVFLERYLEPWCPRQGPIRHFMELVCVGLSKNSYCTAQAKKAHIEWYRDYFMSKKELLKEVGAM